MIRSAFMAQFRPRGSLRSPALCLLLLPFGAGCSLLIGEGLSSGGDESRADAAVIDIDSATSAPDVIDAAPSLPRPAEGVYAYVVTGKDTISAGPTTSAYGPTASMTVVHRNVDDSRCFTGTLAMRARYEDAIDYCIKGSEVLRLEARRTQFFQVLSGIEVATVMKCEPGDLMVSSAPSAGQQWPHFCNGSNVESQNGKSDFTSGGSYTFVAEESVTVGGQSVRVRHFHEELAVKGLQEGTNVTEWYFAIETGILARLTRKVSIRFPTAFDTQYTEDADLTLVSMTPSPLVVDAGTDAN